MKILRDLNPEDLIFFDIETARLVDELQLDTPLFDSWEYKKKRDGLSNDDIVATFKNESALYPEFARIVSIVVGVVHKGELHLKTYDSEDEAVLLKNFNDFLNKNTDKKRTWRLCGFANIGFDSPFIMKRCLINGIEPNYLIDTGGLKPWEVTAIDLKTAWKGTGWNDASLLNITTAFGLPSPKSDISGADVGEVYWKEGKEGLARISKYCANDVIATAAVFMKMRGEQPFVVSQKAVDVKSPDFSIVEKLFNGGKYTEADKKTLVKQLRLLNKVEQDTAFEILSALTSTAKGKSTDFSKADVKELQKLVKK